MKILSVEHAKKQERARRSFTKPPSASRWPINTSSRFLSVNTDKANPPLQSWSSSRPAASRPGCKKKISNSSRRHAHDSEAGATSLAYVNASGWVHRDVKPDNFLVNAACELRLIDFALARKVESDTFLTRLFRRRGMVQGTRSFMSPEQNPRPAARWPGRCLQLCRHPRMN